MFSRVLAVAIDLSGDPRSFPFVSFSPSAVSIGQGDTCVKGLGYHPCIGDRFKFPALSDGSMSEDINFHLSCNSGKLLTDDGGRCCVYN